MFPISHIEAPADPNVEGVGSGMNAASCFNLVGPNIEGPAPKVDDFTQADINPYKIQPLGWGGDSVETGQTDADLPDALVVDYAGSDFNDPCKYTGVEPNRVWTRTATP